MEISLKEISIAEFKRQLAEEPLPTWQPSSRYAADQRWVDKHIAQLVKKYPDQWVAVYNQKVIAASPDLASVQEEANKIADREVTIFFVEGKVYVYQN
ncbi:MAG: DUF5678 domain-containing protein [Anaerolineae bacterium]